MLVYCALLITLVLSFITLRMLWLAGKGGNKSALLSGISLAAIIYLYGPWVFISVYGKYVFVACTIAVLAISLLRKRSYNSRNRGKTSTVLNSLLTVGSLTLVVLYYTGTAGKPYGYTDISLPFKNGTYFVFQGGKGLPTNVFHYAGRHTLFAMDLVKLNRAGNRADRIFSKRLEDYAIFNDTVYSPCNGTVLKAEHNNPDNIPPLRKRGPTNLNQVLIGTESSYIFIGHLKKNSVFVKKGDIVHTGQPLGLVGNSGMSIEPHLHIQAHANTGKGLAWYMEPALQIRYGGKSYLLFEEIGAGR